MAPSGLNKVIPMHIFPWGWADTLLATMLNLMLPLVVSMVYDAILNYIVLIIVKCHYYILPL